MKKQANALILSSVLLGGSLVIAALLIITALKREGEKTRAAMTETADSIASEYGENIVKSASGEIIETAQGNKDEIVGTITTVTRDTLEELRHIMREDASSSSDSQPDESSVPREQRSATNRGNDQLPEVPGELLGDFFRTGQEMSRYVDEIGQDALELNEEEEITLGKELHKVIGEEQAVISNDRLNAKLERLAAPFLRNLKRPGLNYHFTVIDGKELNAFSHLGGYVYVNRGLIESVESDEELQFVLGHEIAHVDLKHCVQQMTYMARARGSLGELGAGLVQVAYSVIAVGYTEDKEFAADERSFRQMGKNQPAAIRFLHRLRKTTGEREPEDPDNALQRGVMEVDRHFRTHPATRDRISRLEAIAQE